MSMSLQPSAASDPGPPTNVEQPNWFWELLGVAGPWDGVRNISGQDFVVRGGIPRSQSVLSGNQTQTEETFGYKWNKRDTFDSDHSRARAREWLIERYGDIQKADWIHEHGDQPLFIDAGCGAGFGGLELLGELLERVHYLGIDVSQAVDVAADRFAEAGRPGAFMQADITHLPFPPASVDLILSEGVLHHTDSTKGALDALSRLLKPGGRILFYVYRRKGPIREFTDDFLRSKLQDLSPEQAWKALEPLTHLGIALGEIDATIVIEAPIDLLGIPAGRYDLQRFFYWHVAKAFYRPELSFDEMNHINYDWYAPANAARQSPEQVRSWCAEFGLEIEREVVEDAGITIIARRVGA
jgi:arsenite methyltransferase